MILMMMTFQITTNCKLVPSKRCVHTLIPLPNPRQQAQKKRHNNLSTRHLSNLSTQNDLLRSNGLEPELSLFHVLSKQHAFFQTPPGA